MENKLKFLDEKGLDLLVSNIKELFNQLNESIETLRSEVVLLSNLRNGFNVDEENGAVDIKLAEGDLNKILKVTNNGIDLTDNPVIDSGTQSMELPG